MSVDTKGTAGFLKRIDYPFPFFIFSKGTDLIRYS